ncbi:MAG: HAD family hydrolase [Deltaproteobacteria bacterium]|nr:HAD family hydrolase [Deltaproteobacteria bacterium]
MKAVIFDLFETLVDFSFEHYSEVIASMARRVGKDPDQFVPAWHANWAKREIGQFGDVADYITALAGPVESEPDLAAAAAIHWACEKQLLMPHADTIATLKSLKDTGYKIGVITNCPMETPTLWSESPLSKWVDCAVFSFVEKTRKPDPAIFLTCLERLGLLPNECVYVGDGANRELEASSAVGMYTIRVGNHHIGAEQNADGWEGPVISSLSELIPHIQGISQTDKKRSHSPF